MKRLLLIGLILCSTCSVFADEQDRASIEKWLQEAVSLSKDSCRTLHFAKKMLGVPYVAMHMRGTPQTMQSQTDYPNGVVNEVCDYFAKRVELLKSRGVENIILDPGFGFAKSVEQNFELLSELDKLCELGYPVLVGLSRKSMIYRPLGITPEEALPGSLALAWEALRGGEAMVRVHDVAATHQVVELANYYKRVGYDKG